MLDVTMLIPLNVEKEGLMDADFKHPFGLKKAK
jgi:hypothetical protein